VKNCGPSWLVAGFRNDLSEFVIKVQLHFTMVNYVQFSCNKLKWNLFIYYAFFTYIIMYYIFITYIRIYYPLPAATGKGKYIYLYFSGLLIIPHLGNWFLKILYIGYQFIIATDINRWNFLKKTIIIGGCPENVKFRWNRLIVYIYYIAQKISKI